MLYAIIDFIRSGNAAAMGGGDIIAIIFSVGIIGIMILLIILQILSRKVYNSIRKQYSAKNYDVALEKSLRFLKWSPFGGYKQQVNCLSAAIYFGKNDIQNTKNFVGKLRNNNLLGLKYYILTLINLFDGQDDLAGQNYGKFLRTYYLSYKPLYEQHKRILDGIFLYKNIRSVEAKNELELLIDDI